MRDAAMVFDQRLRTGLSQPDVDQLEELLARLRDNVSRSGHLRLSGTPGTRR